MDGPEVLTLGNSETPQAPPDGAIAASYVGFFALLLLAHSLWPTPAQLASAALMALSVTAWISCALYRIAWEASHRRNHVGILAAGDPDLEIAAYRHMVGVSARLLAKVQMLAVFVCIPIAILSLALFATSCVIALTTW